MIRITVTEAAELGGVSESTVYRWVYTKRLQDVVYEAEVKEDGRKILRAKLNKQEVKNYLTVKQSSGRPKTQLRMAGPQYQIKEVLE